MGLRVNDDVRDSGTSESDAVDSSLDSILKGQGLYAWHTG